VGWKGRAGKPSYQAILNDLMRMAASEREIQAAELPMLADRQHRSTEWRVLTKPSSAKVC
jgi:hypothetical protein